MIHSPIPRRTIVIGGKGMTSCPFHVPTQMKSETFVMGAIHASAPVGAAAICGFPL
jgi:hypothetical protein